MKEIKDMNDVALIDTLVDETIKNIERDIQILNTEKSLLETYRIDSLMKTKTW